MFFVSPVFIHAFPISKNPELVSFQLTLAIGKKFRYIENFELEKSDSTKFRSF